MTERFPDPESAMRRALQSARKGIGYVEPNPAVGAVIVDDELNLIGEGYHQQFGGPHAEVHAIEAAGEDAVGATLFVTLEPCCHQGKTPPCVDAIIRAGIRRVVVAMQDPAPHVNGGGIERLKSHGVDVTVGMLESQASELIAPFMKRIRTGLPYVHAKWAMSLDGKTAARTGHSQWISNRCSRKVVHELRGRMDAIIVGIGTALTDDPMLTARPPGPRVANRVVLDSAAQLPLDSKLVRSVDKVPLFLAVGLNADAGRVAALEAAGVEVAHIPPSSIAIQESRTSLLDVARLLSILGQRDMTNVLVEGGEGVLGSFFDAEAIDEVHVFVAPKLVGGRSAKTAVAGNGLARVPTASQLMSPSVEPLDGDVYIHGRVRVEWQHPAKQ